MRPGELQRLTEREREAETVDQSAVPTEAPETGEASADDSVETTEADDGPDAVGTDDDVNGGEPAADGDAEGTAREDDTTQPA